MQRICHFGPVAMIGMVSYEHFGNSKQNEKLIGIILCWFEDGKS